MSKEACLCEKVRFFHFISDFSFYFRYFHLFRFNQLC